MSSSYTILLLFQVQIHSTVIFISQDPVYFNHITSNTFRISLRSRIRTVKRHPPFTRYSTKRTVNYLSESESEVPTPIFASAWMWWMAEWRPCSEYRSLAVFSITASWLNILGNYCVAFGLWICGAINLRKKTERAAVRAYLNGI